MCITNAHTVLGSSGSNAALPTRQPSRFGSSEAQSFRSQLNGMLAQSRGRTKILTEKNLQGYLKNNPDLLVKACNKDEQYYSSVKCLTTCCAM